MNIKHLIGTATFAAVATVAASSTFAQGCPSDAICRYDENPGAYDGNGPYDVDSYSMPLFSTPGGATVYYPEDAQPPYAVVVFCPPYLTTQIGFALWGPFLASHGIVTVTMDTTTIYDYPDSRADQQQEVLDAMQDENTRFGSPLRGLLSLDHFGAMGWSMGGGATWITSAEYPGLNMAMSLAGHNITAIDPDASGENTYIPTMLYNGALDTSILGSLGQSDGVYNSIPFGVPKAFYEIYNAGHFDWGYPTQANDYVAETSLAFIKTFLEGDTRWAPYIDEPPAVTGSWEEAFLP